MRDGGVTSRLSSGVAAVGAGVSERKRTDDQISNRFPKDFRLPVRGLTPENFAAYSARLF